MPRPIHALIHPDALAHNIARAREAAPDSRVWAVVKANAYGHGIERAFEGLRGADGFALLDFDEAVRLRALDAVPIGVGLDHGPHARVRRRLAGTGDVVRERVGVDQGVDRARHRAILPDRPPQPRFKGWFPGVPARTLARAARPGGAPRRDFLQEPKGGPVL